ncbi:MAG: DNA mismatch repair protein MutS, partial [Holosporales bacterium]
DWLHTLNPAEIIAPASWTEASSLLDALAPRLHPQAQGLFKVADAESRLAQHYGLFSMAAYGVFPARALAAGAAAVSYIKHTQQASPVALRPPVLWREQERLHIDAATVRNLELLQSSSGNARHSLLSAIDETVSSAGTRLLKDWLLNPLQDIQAIGNRQDAVAYLLSNPALNTKLRDTLKRCGDVERAVTRLRMRRGAPRDLVAISETLAHIEILAGQLASAAERPALLDSILAALPIGLPLTERLENALETPPPPTSRDGGLIRTHYHPRVDELRLAKNDSARLIAQLEGRYKTEHSVQTLKIRHNNLIGYHIEVPLKHADALFSVFQHRATMANAARFTSPELQELERLILSGSGELIDLEHTLFEELIEAALKHQEQLWTAAQALAALDVLCGFAVLAEQRSYCRPVVDESTCFDIIGGRHPVVETLLPSTAPFISNDCSLSLPQRLWLLTGPNMAGKSTFLRQNALIALLAHMGCFVPAASARIGLIDRIFSRVGAGDDLARGQSTFMVEMLETAAILNQATERSLVILDEVGRGTATHDGLSLATAVVEYIHDACRSRALFATHYHELEQLETRLPQLANYHAAVDFYRGDLVFLHTIKRGAARASYGLHIGRKAGLPKRVLERAEAVLAALEKNQSVLVADDAPLFSVAPTTAPSAPTASPSVHPLLLALESLNPDTLSAREALDTLYAWKQTYA